MIQVSAPQVAYVNEIVELVKVFYPKEQVVSSEYIQVQTKKKKSRVNEAIEEFDSSNDMVLEAGYHTDGDSFYFFAYLSKDNRLICEHTNSYPNKNVGKIPNIEENKDVIKKINCNSITNTTNANKPYDSHSKVHYKKNRQIIKNGMKGCVFDLLVKVTGKHPKWGAMTGIRPVKIVHDMGSRGLDDCTIRQKLISEYKLHPEKADLVMRTASVQRPLIDQPGSNKASVYIHVPFCSTRCLYCSFPSDLIERVSGKMDAYLDCLEKEIAVVMDGLSKQNRAVDTIYIGGGTPTVLDHPHLERLLKQVNELILSQSTVLEYTVEAGRPDSLDRHKLQLLKNYGVNRLSINPQSMNQETLDLVGRSHTVEEVINVYNVAREIGFDNINMDVILGLPGETAEHMQRSMEGIAALKPDNITVHTLAMKRASVFKESFEQYDVSRKGLAEEMAAICREWIGKLGMEPYYLYRQKYMLYHLENVGYGLPGKECLYNIQFMHEKRDIWAFGAGASSKIYHPGEDRLERIGNVKNLDEYLTRIDEMIGRKQKALEKES
jgi:coproporphyrinogen dehydrogenase HemZ